MNKQHLILEGLHQAKIDEVSKDITSDPEAYKKYIADTFGEGLIYGDQSPVYDKGLSHVKKLAKMLKKPYQDVMQEIMDMSQKG